MKYFVLVRFWRNNQMTELTREFNDYDDAFNYAKHEYDRQAEDVIVCLYELKDCFN